MSKNTTLRTANIRITGKNATTDGLVEYNKETVKKIIDDFISRYTGTSYAFIEHDKDVSPDGLVGNHFHIFMKFKNPIPFSYLKKSFPFGDIQPARSSNASVQYLVHKNNSDKFQYDRSEIITNFSTEEIDKLFEYKNPKSNRNYEQELLSILALIEDEKIRKFNLHEFIDIDLYSRFKTRINNAFDYQGVKKMVNKNREIDVWFITGSAGSGKTTLAKLYAEKAGVGVCISSSANDLLQDYRGEDTLILDDLRDSDFPYNELLKVLDNHTKSSVRSRYNNKYFEGNLIIITSYRPLTDWYANIKGETKEQLYRRISTLLEVTKKEISVYNLQQDGTKEFDGRIKNPVLDLIKIEKEQREQRTQKIFSTILDGFGIDADKRQDYLDVKIATPEAEYIESQQADGSTLRKCEDGTYYVIKDGVESHFEADGTQLPF